jgi:hypothetical protein
VTENRSVGGSIPPLGTTSCSRPFAGVRPRPYLQAISMSYVHRKLLASAYVRWHPLAPLVHLLAPDS